MGKRRMTKLDCVGCRDNFYNHSALSIGGECWHFKNAKLAKRKAVPLDQRPPWTQPAQTVPSCYKRKGYVYVDGNRTR